MRTFQIVFVALLLSYPQRSGEQQMNPLNLVRTIELPQVSFGEFGHFAIDSANGRLFATPHSLKSVLVIDIASGQVIHEIEGTGAVQAVLYRSDVDRIYVTDGAVGEVKIFDGASYKYLASVRLQPGANSIAYDRATQVLYVANGGRGAGKDYSFVSFIDTNSNEILTDLKINGDRLEAMARELFRARLYVNDRATSTVAVVDAFSRKQIASWPVAPHQGNVAMALDEKHQLLFVGCRSGQMAVLDTGSGKSLQTLPIPNDVGDLMFDPTTRRLYASGDGAIAIFKEVDRDHVISLGTVSTEALAKTSLLVSDLKRYFIAVRREDKSAAHISVFETTETESPTPVVAIVASTATLPFPAVRAPMAQDLVLSTMSAHPQILRLGLHAIPPGQTEYRIVGQGFPSLIGKKSNDVDLQVIRTGETLIEREDSNYDYSLELALSDAAGKTVGLLVFAIPYSAASTEAQAIHMAEGIRHEMQAKIPNRESLFADR